MTSLPWLWTKAAFLVPGLFWRVEVLRQLLLLLLLRGVHRHHHHHHRHHHHRHRHHHHHRGGRVVLLHLNLSRSRWWLQLLTSGRCRCQSSFLMWEICLPLLMLLLRWEVQVALPWLCVPARRMMRMEEESEEECMRSSIGRRIRRRKRMATMPASHLTREEGLTMTLTTMTTTTTTTGTTDNKSTHGTSSIRLDAPDSDDSDDSEDVPISVDRHPFRQPSDEADKSEPPAPPEPAFASPQARPIAKTHDPIAVTRKLASYFQ